LGKFQKFKSMIEEKKQRNPNEQPFQLKDFNFGLQIGAGAFAVVKRAIHKDTQHALAIKTYEKKNLTDKEAKESVQKEINVLSLLEHPNIMGLYEVIDTRTNVNLIMELCSGKSLFHYIKKRPQQKLPEGECKSIIRQLADALAYLHENNVVHRDLKLDNILIDEAKKVKLIDFGFSVMASPEQRLALFCGTP